MLYFHSKNSDFQNNFPIFLGKKIHKPHEAPPVSLKVTLDGDQAFADFSPFPVKKVCESDLTPQQIISSAPRKACQGSARKNLVSGATLLLKSQGNCFYSNPWGSHCRKQKYDSTASWWTSCFPLALGPKEIALWGSDVYIKSCLSPSGPPTWESVCFGWEWLYSLHPEPETDCYGHLLSGCSWESLWVPCLTQLPISRRVGGSLDNMRNESPVEAARCARGYKTLSFGVGNIQLFVKLQHIRYRNIYILFNSFLHP